jgi:hypothetical protein
MKQSGLLALTCLAFALALTGCATSRVTSDKASLYEVAAFPRTYTYPFPVGTTFPYYFGWGGRPYYGPPGFGPQDE